MPWFSKKVVSLKSLAIRPEGFAVVGLLMVVISGVLIAGLVLWKISDIREGFLKTPISFTQLNQQSARILKEKSWKVYQNPTYHFNLTLPVRGMVFKDGGYTEGECGEAIKEEKQKGPVVHRLVKDVVKVDNLFEVKVIEGQGSIDNYLKTMGADREYDYEPVMVEGADEAVKVIGLKKGAEYAVGFPPLVYVSYIIRNGEKIYLIVDLEHPNNEGGCVAERFLDPVKHQHLKTIWKQWNFLQSFKFTPENI